MYSVPFPLGILLRDSSWFLIYTFLILNQFKPLYIFAPDLGIFLWNTYLMPLLIPSLTNMCEEYLYFKRDG